MEWQLYFDGVIKYLTQQTRDVEQRLRRCANISPALGQRLVFAGHPVVLLYFETPVNDAHEPLCFYDNIHAILN